MEGHLASEDRDRRPRRNRRTPWLRLLLLVGVVVAIGWLWQHPALWPLKVTVVLFHELGHAVATWATGGSVQAITLSPFEGGETLSVGGNRLLILNAGYLGSLLAGMGLLASTKVVAGARLVTLGLGVGLLITAVTLVPFLSFGFVFTAAVGVVMLLVGVFVPGFIRRWIVRILGVFSVLYAGMDVYSDVFARALDTTVQSDAVMLALHTGVPAIVWGGAWMVLGVVALILSRRWLV